MSAKKGLGRGFESLIPSELLDESFDPTAAQDDKVSDLRNIKTEEIIADPDQPRRDFEEEALNELAETIREHGVLQPIVVTPHEGRYMIVAGERRWRAAKIAGLDKLPALVRTLSNQHKLELSLIENLQRSDLNPIETATAYLKLRDQFNMTIEEISVRVGKKSGSTISNTLRLLRLPEPVRKALAQGSISEGQVRPLINVDEDIIMQIFPRILAEGWTARAVEQYIVQLKKDKSLAKSEPGKVAVSPYESEVKSFEKKFGLAMQVRTNTRGAGQVVIRFKNEKEFEKIKKLFN